MPFSGIWGASGYESEVFTPIKGNQGPVQDLKLWGEEPTGDMLSLLCVDRLREYDVCVRECSRVR